MEPQLFRSPIAYSVQNEDYQTEQAVLQALDRKADLRVLVVASSGENVLSLLTDSAVASVDAVDLNPAQIALCGLRLVALEHLSRDEQLTLLGCDPNRAGAVGAPERVALFDRLLRHLLEPAREFWESRRDAEVAFGIHLVGRNDTMMRDIASRLRGAGFAPLEQVPSNDQLQAWEEVYTNLLTSTYVREALGIDSEALAGRIAGIAAYLGECHFRALQEPNATQNYFLTTVFANRYASHIGEQGYPLYLQQQGQMALRERGIRQRLNLTTGNVLDQMPTLAAARGGFDLISISNIADWMTEDAFRSVVLLAAKCLKPGGALLARTATGRSMIVDIMAQHMRSDSTLNHSLTRTERGPWFRVIAAGFNA